MALEQVKLDRYGISQGMNIEIWKKNRNTCGRFEDGFIAEQQEETHGVAQDFIYEIGMNIHRKDLAVISSFGHHTTEDEQHKAGHKESKQIEVCQKNSSEQNGHSSGVVDSFEHSGVGDENIGEGKDDNEKDDEGVDPDRFFFEKLARFFRFKIYAEKPAGEIHLRAF